jgi:hypothetical protein
MNRDDNPARGRDRLAAHPATLGVGAQTANERSRGLSIAGEVMRRFLISEGMLTYSPSIGAPLCSWSNNKIL